MSKNSSPIFAVYKVHKKGQDFLDIWYNHWTADILMKLRLFLYDVTITLCSRRLAHFYLLIILRRLDKTFVQTVLIYILHTMNLLYPEAGIIA